MTELLIMAFEFFKTGLFAVGGGLATIPFLYHMAAKYTWLNEELLSNMIAVSESTPGPIGVNMATYVGFTAAGVPGALVTTLSLVLPSLIVIVLVSKVLEKFKNNRFVQDAFYGIRPAVTALILTAGLSVARLALFTKEMAVNVKAVILFAALLVIRFVFKILHPIVIIIIAAAVGVIFAF